MEQLYYNGDIVTMENRDDAPEAVLVVDGVIKAVGSLEALTAQKSADCVMVDLEGNTLMPSFLDGHGHFVMASTQYLMNINLETATNFDEIVALIKAFIEEHQIPAGQPVAGCLYDHNFLEEGEHPDKRVLDSASSEHPIVLTHSSSHMGAVNSMALERAGIDENSENPEGGIIVRYPGTNEPTGVLEESAFIMAKRANKPVITDPLTVAEEAQDIYASYGVTTVQDGAVIDRLIAMLRMLGDAGRLKLDIVTYPMLIGEGIVEDPAEVMERQKDIVGTYKNHVKIGGYKIVLDGSPQGKSAWMTKPYENSGDYCGYPWFKDEVVRDCVRCALNDNEQLLAHCNGDAAADQYLKIYEEELAASDNANKNNLRPVMIHCQTVRDDQLERMAKLNMIPSIFVGHTFFWGDIHLKFLGAERGARISPVKSALEYGLKYNFHTDTPVTQPNMLHCVWAACNRITRGGVEIGKEQCVDVYEALKGITVNAAYMYGEEDSKGSIKEGKRADLVILDSNPLKIDKMAIRDIQVLETIKDGSTIYKKIS